ncbi:MAG: sugar phosphate isomerase/epimerase family protein, partial [Spirochaetales bacterium]
MQRKIAAIIGVFQGRSDRYVVSGYTEQKTFEQLLQDASQVKGLEGIELGARYMDFQNPWGIIEMIKKKGFSIPLLIPDTFASTKYGRGSVIAPDPEVRKQAVEHICQSMDLAEQIGCNMVSPWFGNDGYDYILQLDYLKSWDLMVEAVRTCADHNPKVRIAIEYKVKEPRTHAFLSSTAKALLLIDEVNRPNVGINLDVGHALQGYENMAECACLIHSRGKKLFHIHVND